MILIGFGVMIAIGAALQGQGRVAFGMGAAVVLWLLIRKSPGPIPNKSLRAITGRGPMALDIVGESRYQAALERICGGRTESGANRVVSAILIPDPRTRRTRTAVRVEILGDTVGYLDRRNALLSRGQLDRLGIPGERAICAAKILGGWDRGGGDTGQFGVRLDLPTG